MYVVIGKLVEQVDELKVLMVNNVGYLVNCSDECDSEEKMFFVNRIENKFTDETEYFCFSQKEKFTEFNNLIAKSGVGPKSAFKVLSMFDLETFNEASNTGNYLLLVKSGVKENILRSMVKKEFAKNSDVKYLRKSLSDFGYDKEHVEEVIEQIYDQNQQLDKLLVKGVKLLNEKRTSK